MSESGRVGVLGLGNWGTALAHHLHGKGLPVIGWSIDPNIVEGINGKKENPTCLPGVTLGFQATERLDECDGADVLVLVIPSSALHTVLPRLRLRRETVLVSAIKGFDRESHKTPLQLISQTLGPAQPCGVLSGPSFAKDVAARKPCGIVAGSSSSVVAHEIAELFSSETMKVYTSTDPLGVELGGALKNVISLAAGVSDGLDLGDSARAGLITRGLAEMMRLAVALGARRETLTGLSGLGDLAMTASSHQSRNWTVGFRLGRGESLPHITATLGSVAEGVFTTPIVLDLARDANVEVPISSQVGLLLEGKISPSDMARALMRRPVREEF